MDLSSFRIKDCPSVAHYLPDFITEKEEKDILIHVGRTPKPKWTQLSNRRLINYGGIPHSKGMIAEEIPAWLLVYMKKVNSLGVFESQDANHILINEYLPGQGIMPHTDGPLFYPTICTISCGSHTVIEFTNKDRETYGVKDKNNENIPKTENYKFFLEPRSLLIVQDDLYSNFLHSIQETKYDVLCENFCNYCNCLHFYNCGDFLERNTRISLTIRNVPKTTNLILKF